MKYDQIITLISLCLSAVSIIFSFLVVSYRISREREFEKEKTRLEIFSNFLAYCKKKAAGKSTLEDDFELVKLHSKLCLVTDHKLNKNTENLFNSLFTNPTSLETVALLDKETQEMWLRLKIFNRRFGQRFPHF